ncbi:type VI secretion system-associated protein TagF [Arvimicrobium flavum]|uniref:type VI secretion system-associated protein TagF n=1 Tax=Arvimicrobium flavum TaxID=3393320 RepID=UPI00237C1157|nr:type VI secretion system-associated protein TagF [Mesorhizobium shangrilense]
MGFGLFGKLPQKRDFISLGIAPSLLAPLETWLQSALAASRAELGRDWERHYLVAPLWRFWIGPSVLGTTGAGVVMPSVDGVGRYFPLMALYACAETERVPPPPFAPQSEWYAAIEARLLATLDADGPLAIDTLLADLPAPSLERVRQGEKQFKGGTLWNGPPHSSPAALLTGIVEADYRQTAEARSFWWTTGSEASGPLVYSAAGLPDPYFYTLMLKSVAD